MNDKDWGFAIGELGDPLADITWRMMPMNVNDAEEAIMEISILAGATVFDELDEHGGGDRTDGLIQPLYSHIYHAYNHILLFLRGDEKEDHLSHALTRLAMAEWVRKRGKDEQLR